MSDIVTAERRSRHEQRPFLEDNCARGHDIRAVGKASVDGCGRCCLNKLEDWETGEIAWTDMSRASLLDSDSLPVHATMPTARLGGTRLRAS